MSLSIKKEKENENTTKQKNRLAHIRHTYETHHENDANVVHMLWYLLFSEAAKTKKKKMKTNFDCVKTKLYEN